MHTPVLLQEVLDGLQLRPNDSVMDGTLGGGGHARQMLVRTGPSGIVVGFDRDLQTLQKTIGDLQEFGDRLIPIHDSYAGVLDHAEEWGRAKPFRAILLDLGLSSLQIDNPDRGFSFRFESPLDMRFDTTRGETAAEVLNTRSEDELRLIFQEYGQVQRSRTLAKAIVEERRLHQYATTLDLLTTIEQVCGRGQKRSVHPAAQVFQALRIEANHELEQLQQFLPVALQLLAPGGRLAVISFHSLEDRMVKQFMVDALRNCICPPELPECRCSHRATAVRVTKKPIIPSPEEVAANPRSRSAKLRIIEKIS